MRGLVSQQETARVQESADSYVAQRSVPLANEQA